MGEEDIEKQLILLKKRIKYDSDAFEDMENYTNILSALLEDSLNIALTILYPFEEEYDNINLPRKYYNWQIRACVELYNLAGRENVSSYSENGLSWTMFKSGLSQELLDELTSKAKAPIIRKEEGSE